MKRKSISGVTLLEIMLVLAIAAMVIVMSIRYYSSATLSQQTNTVMQQIISVTAAADNLAQGAGTYTAATDTSIKAIVGANNLGTPWGDVSSWTITPGTISYTVALTPLPLSVCTSLAAKLAPNVSGSHVKTSGCTGTGNAATLNYTYNAAANP